MFQVLRAASLVYSTCWFIRLLKAGQLAGMDPSSNGAAVHQGAHVTNFCALGDFERADPLCMTQYAELFGTTRIPQFGRDKLVTDYNSNHVAVVCRDQYYWFDISDQVGEPK